MYCSKVHSKNIKFDGKMHYVKFAKQNLSDEDYHFKSVAIIDNIMLVY